MYKLSNYTEEVVIRKTDEILQHMNICSCEKCRLDIMAIALNNLPAKYVVTEIGHVYSKIKELEQQYGVDIETEVTKAAVFVSNNPKHE